MVIINVNDRGILPNTGELLRSKVQNLVDSISEEATLIFPKGTYILATISTHSNLHFVFEEGCLILGSNDFYDFAPQEKLDYPTYQDQSHSYFDCSLFVGRNINNISFEGPGVIDMQSTWDLDNVRDIVHRGPKAFAFKECNDLRFSNFELYNVTDLAVYFAGCNNVLVEGLKLRVYIDGVSPDNSKNVVIRDCEIEAGDDAIVFKSSYTLNRLDICDNILVENCSLKSRCNAIKFGTETNGGFENINIRNIKIRETRMAGIAIESVDGAKIDGINISNIEMKNVASPLFIFLGKRLRGPEGLEIGSIKNILIENLVARGPYVPYEVIEWNYRTYVIKDNYQYPWHFGGGDGVANLTAEEDGPWQFISNVCGLPGHYLENITLRNIDLELAGGCKEYDPVVKENAQPYPEVYVYGKVLPAKGIYFRHVKNLNLENVKVTTLRPDVREDFVFEDIQK